MRPAPAAALGLAFCLVAGLPPCPALAWDHTGLRWPDDASPIALELHNAPAGDLSVDALEDAVLRSAATWSDVPCASVQLAYAGRTDRDLGHDGHPTLQWIDDPDAWIYGSLAAGATLTFEDPDQPNPQVDIAFNASGFQWRTGGDLDDPRVLDPQAVITHELGHLLGLAHTDTSSAATMAPLYLVDASQRSLALDDKAGLCALYWTPGDECDDDSACPAGDTCQTWSLDSDRAARLCAEPHGAFGDPCALNDLNCQGLCRFSSADRADGTCTSRCDDDDDCPCGWSCRDVQPLDNPLRLCLETPPDDADAGCDTPDADAGPAPGDRPPDCDCALSPASPRRLAPLLPGGGLLAVLAFFLSRSRRS